MILIRADANEIIGTGHVMRCLSVADAFLEIGENVVFVTADHRGDTLIKSKGLDIYCLESCWSRMEEETGTLIDLIKVKKPSLVLVDSYYVTEEYFNALAPNVKLAYFDDMNSGRWSVDYLINYNVFANVLDYSWYLGTKTKLLLDPKYAPLRKEFRNMPAHVISDKVTDVLVSAGGADPERISERLIREVCPCWQDACFHFVVGALNPRLEALEALSSENVMLHINEQNMSALMKRCDIAVAAAGTTLYELCACGTPTVTYALADNQITAEEQFAALDLMLSAGDCRMDDLFIDRLEMSLRTLADNKEKRKKKSKMMQKLIDGNGAARIARVLAEGKSN